MNAIDLVIPLTYTDRVLRAAETSGVAVSPPMSYSDPADLNSPLDPGSIKEALELATLIFTTPLAIGAFFSKVRDMFDGDDPPSTVHITDPRSGRKICSIRSSGDVEVAIDLVLAGWAEE